MLGSAGTLLLMRNENESYGEVFDNIALTMQQNLVTKMPSELLNLEFNVPSKLNRKKL